MSVQVQKLSALAGVIIVALIVGGAGSLMYYQFGYLPEKAPKGPPPEYLTPKQNITVTISEGSVLPTNAKFYVPETISLVLGVNNTVVWVNNDSGIIHTVTSDDPGSRFAKAATAGNFLGAEKGASWKYTFVEPGVFKYHCSPHPWMRGTVTVLLPAS